VLRFGARGVTSQAVDLAVALVAVAVFLIGARDDGRDRADARLAEIVFAPASATVRLERIASGELQLTQPAGVTTLRGDAGVALAVRGGATL